MKAGAVAAAFAGLPLKSALGSNGHDATTDPVIRPSELTATASSSSTLPLSQSIEQLGYYSKSAFTPYVNTKFRVYLGPSNIRGLKLVEVGDYLNALVQVDPTASATGTECFSLLFTAYPGKPFQQETCMIEHEALGTFYMFVVPVSKPSKTNPDYYEAVIYRRPQSSVAQEEPTIDSRTEPTGTTQAQPARNPWRVASGRGEREVFTFGSLIPAPKAIEPPPAPVDATWVTIARDRGISGLKLGMTSAQVLALFPGSEADQEVLDSLAKSANQFGMTSLVIKPEKYSSKEEFAGINQIVLSLLDDRVSTLYVGYDATQPEHVDELVTKFSKGRNLPTASSWAAYTGLDDQLKTMKCKDFEISVFAGGKNVNFNYVQMVDSAAQQKLKQRRAEAKKRMMNKAKP